MTGKIHYYYYYYSYYYYDSDVTSQSHAHFFYARSNLRVSRSGWTGYIANKMVQKTTKNKEQEVGMQCNAMRCNTCVYVSSVCQ